jgi:DNA invertase Pin-like site-specific DNA recombinase
MIIGYARTSTTDQKAGLEAQHRELNNAGCEKIFSEEVSSVDKAARKELEAALEFARDGDVVVVTKLDRLARSVAHLLQLVETIETKGVSLRILDLAIDTATPTGRLMLTLIGGIAQFEREIMLERQREGIAKAKADGRYKGRKATAVAKSDEIKKLTNEGMKPLQIAKELSVGKSSVYRILNESEAQA